ncbi:YaiI/YqxD family protein [Thioalkalivibrio sp.]|uniref:YaiI/YqxD family protein n=1 Tax=Thioalkalivibrio sp. TaxID=2093813 RepID=UPI003976B1DD
MKIWVDADACPVVIKEILFRAAERARVQVTLVANQPVRVPRSRYVRMVCVGAGFDVADNEIVARLEPGDLVITGDIPLAAEVIDKGGHALNPRGELYAADTIKSRLDIRDFMETLRSSGIDTGGPPALNQRDRQNFANHLDRFLTRHAKAKERADDPPT